MAKTAVGLIDRSVTVLLVVAAVLLAAALAISRRRTRTLAELGLWFAALTTAAYFIALGVGHAITTGLTVDAARSVAVAVVDALFNSLRSPATVLVVSGIVVAVLSLLAGLLVPRARGHARA